MNAPHWRVDESFRHPIIPSAQLSQKAFCKLSWSYLVRGL